MIISEIDLNFTTQKEVIYFAAPLIRSIRKPSKTTSKPLNKNKESVWISRKAKIVKKKNMRREVNFTRHFQI